MMMMRRLSRSVALWSLVVAMACAFSATAAIYLQVITQTSEQWNKQNMPIGTAITTYFTSVTAVETCVRSGCYLLAAIERACRRSNMRS